MAKERSVSMFVTQWVELTLQKRSCAVALLCPNTYNIHDRCLESSQNVSLLPEKGTPSTLLLQLLVITKYYHFDPSGSTVPMP